MGRWEFSMVFSCGSKLVRASKKWYDIGTVVSDNFCSLVKLFNNVFHSWLCHTWKHWRIPLLKIKKMLFTTSRMLLSIFFFFFYQNPDIVPGSLSQWSFMDLNQQHTCRCGTINLIIPGSIHLMGEHSSQITKQNFVDSNFFSQCTGPFIPPGHIQCNRFMCRYVLK